MTDTIRAHRGARNTLPARDLAQISIFAALIAALGLAGPLNIGPVPITLQTLGVMFAGAILGPRKGTLAVLLFLVLTAVGLPLLAGGRGGIGAFTVSPAAGYLYGWLLGAFVIGYLTQRLLPKYPFWPALGATILGGIVAVYLVGIPVMALNLGLPLWTTLGLNLAFLPGDLIKVIVTVFVAGQVHRAYPGLIPRRRAAPAVPAESTTSTTSTKSTTSAE